MLACQKGFLPVVKCLIDRGAKVEGRDRFKRTPLIHACMYGNAHIVSFLLRLGANANVFDSSSNTALHYAIAYGWYFCVRLLIEAGANVNCTNCWQTTCLEAGFSKGHYGICDYLLTEHQADINFKSDDGVTLVMITVDIEISPSSVQQLDYVVVKHKANCTCVDINGRNAFHYLALNGSAQTSNRLAEKDEKILKQNVFRMAHMLLDHQCDPLPRDNKAQTPLMLALESRNFLLVDFLINEAKLEINVDVSHDGKTLLHYFAMNCDNEQLTQTLINLPMTDDLKQMGQVIDNQGRTPFHYCAERFEQFCRGSRSYARASIQEQYQWIVNMVRYCLETIECDPDLGIKPTEDKSIDNESDKNIAETSIFYLLRTVSLENRTIEHPLELFLKKTKNINVLHHQTRRTPLLEAIHLNQYGIFKILMRQPLCDINLATSVSPDEGQQTPLILACKLQYFLMIRDLLNHPQCNLLAYDDQHNQALHYYLATSERSDEYLEIFHLFVEKLKLIGKDTLHSQGKSNCTLLHIAVYHNLGTFDSTNDVERTLIDNDCDLLMKDDLGNLPLHNVFLPNKRVDDPVELCVLLLQAMKYKSLDTKNNEGNTPLHLAVIKASTVCIMLLLKHQASLLIENELSNSPIASCIASNHLNLLITFLHQDIDIDLSKLYIASTSQNDASDSDFDCSSSMEVEKISPTIENNKLWQWEFGSIPKVEAAAENYSLIHIIIRCNWQGALSLVLDDLNRFHLKYIQVFEAAIKNNQLNLILCLLKNIKDQTVLNEMNSHGRNLFHLIAILLEQGGQVLGKILTYLYDNHIVWNVPDKYGSYPLHYACALHNIPLLNFLQKKYSDDLNFNQVDSFGNTAYGLLFWSSATQSSFDRELLRTFITSGKSIDCLCNYDNEIAINPLSFGSISSSSGNSIPYPPVITERTSPHVRVSPLINAVVHNHFQLAQFLMELGADVNFPDEEKRTPLMHAIRQVKANLNG